MSEKHKKNITSCLSEDDLNNTLSTVKNMIKSLPPKQQHLMSDWLKIWCKYIQFEKTFIPQKLKYYKRGEIVLAHFGYNTGSELGGKHYAVVVENNNNNANNTITVVPLSSLDENENENDLHKSDVYLGEVVPNSGKRSFAKPSQIRAISKLRIIKPKHKEEEQLKISGAKLQEIDKKIIELFTKTT